MDICKRVIRIIEYAQSPGSALLEAVAAIEEDQRSDACGVFLRGHGGQLVLWRRHGEGLDARTRGTAEAVIQEALARVQPATAEIGRAHV